MNKIDHLTTSLAVKDKDTDKIKLYLEMVLERLDKHSDSWNCLFEKNTDYSVKLLELEYYSLNLVSYLNGQNINLEMIWKSLNLVLDPIWNISQDIFSIFGELDSLYSELVLLSSDKKIDFDIQINKLNEWKNRPTYIRIRDSETIQAGRSLIASLKEHCFRTFNSQISEFKSKIIHCIAEILNLSKQHLSLSNLWISHAVTSIEFMKFKTEDALKDLKDLSES